VSEQEPFGGGKTREKECFIEVYIVPIQMAGVLVNATKGYALEIVNVASDG
jgi:hypothetical protein